MLVKVSYKFTLNPQSHFRIQVVAVLLLVGCAFAGISHVSSSQGGGGGGGHGGHHIIEFYVS